MRFMKAMKSTRARMAKSTWANPGQGAVDGEQNVTRGSVVAPPQTQSPQTLPKTSFIQVPIVPPTSVSMVWALEG